MNVLIVQGRRPLALIWQRHLMRQGAVAVLAEDEVQAIRHLDDGAPDVLILDIVLPQGSAFAVADVAAVRHPRAKVIFGTSSSFFADGSIFNLCANACAFLPSATPPGDLAALVEHYGRMH